MLGNSVEKVLDLQSEFLRRLAKHNPPPQHSVPSLLYKIIECDEDLLDFTLGQIGQKLRSFAQNVDFQHPEIASIFDGLIANDQDFSKDCIELLTLGQFAKEHNLHRIVPVLSKVLSKEIISKNIIRKIETPQNNRMHVRLLKDVKDREDIRMTKRMQTIDLQSVYRKGEEIWNAQPDNFTQFLRFDTAYQEDLKVAEKKAQRYEELGCIALSDEIKRSIESFREHMEQSYYGFNRITMTNAAVILAKSLGYSFIPYNPLYTVSEEPKYKIVVKHEFFGKYNFDPDHLNLELSPIVSQIAGVPVFSKKQAEPYLYEPRVYPVHEFYDVMTNNVSNTISLLESFPDAGGKPIFDHFGVIVPGIALSKPNRLGFNTFLDESGMVQSYISKEEALKTLDKILIKGEYFYGILIGEKDGKCYFISYFI